MRAGHQNGRLHFQQTYYFTVKIRNLLIYHNDFLGNAFLTFFELTVIKITLTQENSTFYLIFILYIFIISDTYL